MDAKRLLRFIALSALLLSAGLAGADNYTRELIDNETLSRLKVKIDKGMEIDNAKKEKARKIVDSWLGEEGMKVINNRIAEISGRMDTYNISDNLTAEDADIAAAADMIVFISSSMPADTLKRYIEDADGNAIFVLRGTVGSPKTIMPTINFIKSILCDEKMSCKEASIIIDPELFKTYSVERVPTVIVRAGQNDYRFVGAMPLGYIREKAQQR
jgi:type-F conjugative transfer system pilin assembly protein TrbC